MEKIESNICYVNSHTDDKQIIANIVAKNQNIGIYIAQMKVDKWFSDFSEFVFDTQTGNLLFYHLKTRGYWEIVKDVSIIYKQF